MHVWNDCFHIPNLFILHFNCCDFYAANKSISSQYCFNWPKLKIFRPTQNARSNSNKMSSIDSPFELSIQWWYDNEMELFDLCHFVSYDYEHDGVNCICYSKHGLFWMQHVERRFITRCRMENQRAWSTAHSKNNIRLIIEGKVSSWYSQNSRIHNIDNRHDVAGEHEHWQNCLVILLV